MKPGSVLQGTLSLTLGNQSASIPGVELRIKTMERRKFTGELYVPKDPADSQPKTLPLQRVELDGNQFRFSVNWVPLSGIISPSLTDMKFVSSLSDGRLSAKLDEFQGPIRGHISFELKK
jgi:hypothetical protein